MKKVSLAFYLDDDVVAISRALLGMVLMTKIDGSLTGGVIVETEAYRGPEDRASHAFGGRRTPRNEAMYRRGGIAYVYRCYGMHNLFNVVTNQAQMPHAVLIRAIEPITGIDTMLQRRSKVAPDATLTNGPGSLCRALGITTLHNMTPLNSSVVWIEDHGIVIPPRNIVAGPRVGVDYAGQDAKLPWRFMATQGGKTPKTTKTT